MMRTTIPTHMRLTDGQTADKDKAFEVLAEWIADRHTAREPLGYIDGVLDWAEAKAKEADNGQ